VDAIVHWLDTPFNARKPDVTDGRRHQGRERPYCTEIAEGTKSKIECERSLSIRRNRAKDTVVIWRQKLSSHGRPKRLDVSHTPVLGTIFASHE
jgi:hypothetical protein